MLQFYSIIVISIAGVDTVSGDNKLCGSFCQLNNRSSDSILCHNQQQEIPRHCYWCHNNEGLRCKWVQVLILYNLN
jgi:hypothetical protein